MVQRPAVKLCFQAVRVVPRTVTLSSSGSALVVRMRAVISLQRLVRRGERTSMTGTEAVDPGAATVPVADSEPPGAPLAFWAHVDTLRVALKNPGPHCPAAPKRGVRIRNAAFAATPPAPMAVMATAVVASDVDRTSSGGTVTDHDVALPETEAVGAKSPSDSLGTDVPSGVVSPTG